MPIRPPNFEPPFNVVRIAYVDCHVVDPAASKTFWVDALGFVVTENGIVSDPQIPVGLGSGNLISGTVSK